MSGSTVPIIVLAGVVLFALVLFLVFARLMRKSARGIAEAQARQREQRERIDRAIYAQAVVMSAQSSATTGQSEIRVELSLEVRPPGAASYYETTTWMVELASLPQVQPGNTLQIKIDCEDPRLIYPSGDWAKFWLWD